MSDNFLVSVSRCLTRLGSGFTQLPRNSRFEHSPFVQVTWTLYGDLHEKISLGRLIPHGLSTLPLKTHADAIDGCLKAEAMATFHCAGTRVQANRGSNVGFAEIFLNNQGEHITISVGGVPDIEAQFYLRTMASYLRDANIIL